MVDEHPVLRRAMAIHGAQSISVVSLTTGEAVWSTAGAAGEDVAEIVADMVGVAARVVGLTDGGSAMDDLVLSSLSWFHVMRLVAGTRQGPCVVHLVLDRRVANLALARRELKALVDTALRQPELEAAPAATETLPHRTSTKNVSTIDIVVAPIEQVAEDAAAFSPEDRPARGAPGLPTWLEQFAGQPFETDTNTIERVLAGLRGLHT